MPREKEEQNDWQRKVRQSEMILQSAGEGISVVDAAGKISFINEAAVKMLGGAAADFAEMRFDRAFFGRDFSADELAVSPIQFALSEGEKSQVNNETFARRDRSEIAVEYICAPLKENEKVTGAVITFQDITARLDLEAALAEARDAALEAARAKAAFLANMSHEIRTPLGGIIGAADLLSTTDLSPRQNEYARILKSSAALLLALVNDLLDFSKIEAGRIEIETREFDLRELLKATVALFQTEAAAKNLVLKTEIAENVGDKFFGDDARLRQILNNLVGNAVKFTARGEIRARVFETSRSGEEITLRFEIADTGIGISETEMKKLFQPFTQADVSTTRRFGGTGLGLAISRELVKLMRGEIGVESAPGKGSTFWFTVELVPSSEFQVPSFKFENRNLESEIESRKIENDKKLETWDLGLGTKILVAEDNEISRRIVAETLRQAGFAVWAAANGAEAVRLWQEKRFDVVLMDCRMPEMDGYAATRRIRELEGGARKTKIIALTAGVAAGEEEKCLRAGMDDYLAKPVSRRELVNYLNVLLKSLKSPENLDLDGNLGQHLSAYIAKEKLENFLEIESRGNENFAAEMLRLYLEHAAGLCEKIKDALKMRDREAVKQSAHSLRGSSGNVGLSRVFADAAELEKEVDAGDWARAEEILLKIAAEHDKIKKLFSKNN